MSNPEKDQLEQLKNRFKHKDTTIGEVVKPVVNENPTDFKGMPDLGSVVDEDKPNYTPLFVMLGLVIVALVVFIGVMLSRKEEPEVEIIQLTYQQAEINDISEELPALSDNMVKWKKQIAKERYENTTFVGDSLTEGIGLYGYQDVTHMVAERGTHIFQAMEKVKKIKNTDPQYVMIMLGINDLNNSAYDMKSIIANYKKLIKKIHKQVPDAKIYVESLLPVTAKYEKSHKALKNSRIVKLNTKIEKMADEFDYVEYIDLHSLYVNKNGVLPSDMSSDGYHLYPDGYKKWIKKVKQVLKDAEE